jgi:hypothetical protein
MTMLLLLSQIDLGAWGQIGDFLSGAAGICALCLSLWLYRERSREQRFRVEAKAELVFRDFTNVKRVPFCLVRLTNRGREFRVSECYLQMGSQRCEAWPGLHNHYLAPNDGDTIQFSIAEMMALHHTATGRYVLDENPKLVVCTSGHDLQAVRLSQFVDVWSCMNRCELSLQIGELKIVEGIKVKGECPVAHFKSGDGLGRVVQLGSL